MKKNILRNLVILTNTVLLITSPLNVLASSGNSQPTIVIGEEAKNIPDYIVEKMVKENPDAGVINIYDYGDVSEIGEYDNKENTFLSLKTTTLTKIENVKTTKVVTNSNHLAKDEFKFSVAKGEKVELSVTYTGQLTGSISGGVYKASQIGASITIKGTYKRGTTYNGPAENSPYNSREFRMKFYEEVGTYKQTADQNTYFNYKITKTKKVSTSGTYKKPTKYISYSIDKKY